MPFLESFNGDTCTEQEKLTYKENLGIGIHRQKTFQNEPNKDQKESSSTPNRSNSFFQRQQEDRLGIFQNRQLKTKKYVEDRREEKILKQGTNNLFNTDSPDRLCEKSPEYSDKRNKIAFADFREESCYVNPNQLFNNQGEQSTSIIFHEN